MDTHLAIRDRTRADGLVYNNDIVLHAFKWAYSRASYVRSACLYL